MPRRPEQTRDTTKPIKVFVTAGEREGLKARAASAGLGVSPYLRAAGMGAPIRSVLDLKAVAKLAQVNADQARLAALLRTTAIADPSGVPELLLDIRRLQGQISDIAKKVRT